MIHALFWISSLGALGLSIYVALRERRAGPLLWTVLVLGAVVLVVVSVGLAALPFHEPGPTPRGTAEEAGSALILLLYLATLGGTLSHNLYRAAVSASLRLSAGARRRGGEARVETPNAETSPTDRPGPASPSPTIRFGPKAPSDARASDRVNRIPSFSVGAQLKLDSLRKSDKILRGAIIDQIGASMPGVTVTLVGREGSKVTVSNVRGDFSFLDSAPGEHELLAELEGFVTLRKKIAISGNWVQVLADLPTP